MKLRKEEALTFDDVLLVPKKSDIVSRSLVNTSTYFTKNVKINIPIGSLQMATVTESDMAIAMAREGGIGIIHRFMPIEEQAAEVKRVKKSIGRVIENPLTAFPELRLGDALELMESNDVTSLLITNKENKLSGILTKRDYVFEKNMDVEVKELMTKRDEIVTGSPEISLEEAKRMLVQNKIEKLPLVDSNDHIKGLIATKSIQHLEKHTNACRDKKGRLLVGAAVGVKEGFVERAQALVDANVDVIVLDIAHAHSKHGIETVKKLKSKFNVDVLAGNVATAEGAKDLIKAGADGIKVGIGNGTICTTRLVAGAGVPQFTAIQDCYKVGNKFGVPIVSEGGIAGIGNFVKALAAGANAHMFGSVFAGTTESPGPIVYRNGKRFKHYHGSTSYMNTLMRQTREEGKKVNGYLRDAHVEGVESFVPYKGPVSEILHSYVKGLKSGMSYCNANNIVEMHANAEFVRITNAGFKESGAHDVEVQ